MKKINHPSLKELEKLDPNEPIRTALSIISCIAEELSDYSKELKKQSRRIHRHSEKIANKIKK